MSYYAASFYNKITSFLGIKRGIERFILKSEELDLPPKPKILDAGCGFGIASFAFLKRYPDAVIYACDDRPEMLHLIKEEARRSSFNLNNFHIQKVRLDNLENTYPENYFDCVITNGSLERSDYFFTLPMIYKVLKKHGVYLNLAFKDNFWGKMIGFFIKIKPIPEAELKMALKGVEFFDIRKENFGLSSVATELSRVAFLGNK